MPFSDPETTANSGNKLVNGLLWGMHWNDPGSAGTRLKVYVAGQNGGENFDFGGFRVTADTLAKEVSAFTKAMQLIEAVCNIDFTFTSSKADADIIVGAVDNVDAEGNLGIAIPPGEDVGPLNSQQGAVIVNYEAYSTGNLSSLNQGGYDFATFIHEMLHAIGLKHPHDRGGGTFWTFPGVSNGAAFDDLGDNNLNQGIYTTMSYNDGFITNPDGKIADSVSKYGYQGTPMALDIAALQYLFGANTTYRTGDNTYILPSANQGGTFYSCIWDSGGADTIRNNSALNCTIDLREALLTNTAGGGGFVSSIKNVYGGFTIANGAVIESAIGGSGADKLMGNSVDNILRGGAGNDRLSGGAGADKISGNAGVDVLAGGAGEDCFYYGALTDSSGAGDTINGFQAGLDEIRVSAIDADATLDGNQAFVFNGEGALTGEAGEIRFAKNAATNTTWVRFDDDGDGVADMVIKLSGQINLTADDFLL